MRSLTPDPAEFLTLKDVAREIGVSDDTIAKKIKAGEMPGQKIGLVYRIPVVQWNAYKAGTWRARPATEPIELIRRRA